MKNLKKIDQEHKAPNDYLVKNLNAIKKFLPINVMVTAAGSANSINVIQALKELNKLLESQKAPKKKINIVTIDADPYSAGLFLGDKMYVVPKVNDSSFFPELYKIVEKENIKIIIPINSKELMVFSKFKDEIFKKTGITLAICPHDLFIQLDDKLKFNLLMKDLKILTPKTETLDMRQVLNEVPNIYIDIDPSSQKINDQEKFIRIIERFLEDDLLKRYHYPFIIKSRIGSGSSKVWLIKNQSQFLSFAQNLTKKDIIDQNYIVQEFIKGREYTIDFCNDLNGKFLGGVIRERLQVRDGKSVKARTIVNKDIIKQIKYITEKIGYIGPGNFQGILANIDDKEPQFYFIECNPRFAAGGLPLTVHLGFNIPLLILKMILEPDKKIDIFENYPENIIMLRYFTQIFAKSQFSE